jgi:hypothetical protein
MQNNLLHTLQQELQDKENKLLILEKTKIDLEQQVKQIAFNSEQKIITLEKQVQDLKQNQYTISQLEEQYKEEKNQWETANTILEKNKDTQIMKLQELCESYKIEILDLHNQLDLEEQTIQVKFVIIVMHFLCIYFRL